MTGNNEEQDKNLAVTDACVSVGITVLTFAEEIYLVNKVSLGQGPLPSTHSSCGTNAQGAKSFALLRNDCLAQNCFICTDLTAIN
jgi:hypothetical protein